MKQTYISNGTLQMGRVMHPAGSPVKLDPEKDDVAGLLARGAIAEVRQAAHAAADGEGLDASEGTRKLLPKIAASTSLLAVAGLLDAEQQREGGPRKSVLDAGLVRLDELKALRAPTAGDDGDADGDGD
jgi:hypothetical protein